jgi:DNA-binding GntR family transcriptional regulator
MNRPNLSDSVEKAYRAIREWILDGTLEAGQDLRESDLGERIGVSRTPVRAALSRLEAEGLVVYERYRRYTVASLTLEEIDKIFELRVVLEGLAARRAATRIAPEALRELRALNAGMLDCCATQSAESTRRYDALNTGFHRIILQAADSRRLEAMLNGLIDLPLSFLSEYQPSLTSHFRRSCQHHDEIIRALEGGNADWAEAQMQAHLQSVRVG